MRTETEPEDPERGERNMKRTMACLLTAMAVPTFAASADRPVADEVRKVIEYYHAGAAQGVILVDALLCERIDTRPDSRTTCAGSPPGSTRARNCLTRLLGIAKPAPLNTPVGE